MLMVSIKFILVTIYCQQINICNINILKYILLVFKLLTQVPLLHLHGNIWRFVL